MDDHDGWSICDCPLGECLTLMNEQALHSRA